MEATTPRYSDSEWRKYVTQQEREFRRYLQGLARVLTRNEEQAEDLVQDTLERVLKNGHQFTPGTNFKAWISMVMRNHFYSEKRRSWRWTELDPEVAERTLATSGMPQAESSLEWQDVLLFLPCLSEEQRDALIAVGYIQWSYEEAAWALDVMVGTVKSRVSRARRELQELMSSGTPVWNDSDLELLRTATRGIPPSHPFYPIAEAYEFLYRSFEIPPSCRKDANVPRMNKYTPSKGDEAWETFVRSGGLDNDELNVSDLLMFDPEE